MAAIENSNKYDFHDGNFRLT